MTAMYKEPNILMAHIPVTSPYYNRIHALKMERDFASPASPDRQSIEAQIVELSNRALRRMEADNAVTLL